MTVLRAGKGGQRQRPGFQHGAAVLGPARRKWVGVFGRARPRDSLGWLIGVHVHDLDPRRTEVSAAPRPRETPWPHDRRAGTFKPNRLGLVAITCTRP